MNRQLRGVSTVVVLMFVALFVSTTSIQFFAADSLRADTRNSRTILDSYSTKRGAILVNGTPIAESSAVDDQYRYQATSPSARATPASRARRTPCCPATPTTRSSRT
jgi:peptidoglycan glycosyltransferase